MESAQLLFPIQKVLLTLWEVIILSSRWLGGWGHKSENLFEKSQCSTPSEAGNQPKSYQAKSLKPLKLPNIHASFPVSRLKFTPKPETTSARFHHVPGTVSLTSFHATLKHPNCKVHVAGVTKPGKLTLRKAFPSHPKLLFTLSPQECMPKKRK